MAQPTTEADAYDITVRVGCSLTYEVAGSATLLLNIKPKPDRRQILIEESLVLGKNLRTDAFDDSHGNRVHRLSLPAGRHEIRHDAIVRVYAQPDNHDLMKTAPLPPADLPPGVLRYTLPSRYCDSDKLGRFAWEKFGQVEHGWPRVQAISEWVHRNIEYR